MSFALSVLDLSPIPSGSTGVQALHNTIELAQLADRLGFKRYWVAEHHNIPSVASSSPEIMIGQIARVTSSIRVGSGGIMLPNHIPLKVVQTFRVLEALFPGRIDLGIGRAPGTDPLTAMAIRGRASAGAEDFPRQLQELLAFDRGSFPDGHPYQSITPIPSEVRLPPVYLLGSSQYSAYLAAHLGLGYGHAYHIGPRDVIPAVRAYRENFRPSDEWSEPYVIVTASVVCAETAKEADWLAKTLDLRGVRMRLGIYEKIPSPEEAAAYPFTLEERAQIAADRKRHFIGDPQQVKAQIEEFAQKTGADEIMILATIHDHSKRLRCYELLAEVFGLAS